MDIIKLKYDAGQKSMDEIAIDWVNRVKDNEIIVGIIGLGYVGIPLAEAFVNRGIKTFGFDIMPSKIDDLLNGKSYMRHISDDRIARMVGCGLFMPTTDFSKIDDVDAILLCVPTPLAEGYEPDLKYVEKSCEQLAPYLRRGQMVVLESTTWPGTCEEIMQPILERISGLKAHDDFAIVHSPEREDPGNIQYSTSSIDKIVGANTKPELDMALAVYGVITKTVPVSDLRTAEAVKLTENIYRFINISLANELNMIFGKMGIDTWEVMRAAATKPFGFQPFYPGPGIGGHCIPIDPFYLVHKSKKDFNITSRFIELSGEITHNQPRRIVDQTASILKARFGKDIKGANVLLLGIAYKKNIDDMRESPVINMVEVLKEYGANVEYHDPFCQEVDNAPEHAPLHGMKSIELTAQNITKFDCAIIATDHDGIDYAMVADVLPFVLDTRNATHRIIGEFKDKIVKAH